MYAQQILTAIECRTTDARNAIGDSDALEAITATECRITDARDTIWDTYALEAITVIEYIITDARDAIGDNNICYKSSIQIQIARTKKRI